MDSNIQSKPAPRRLRLAWVVNCVVLALALGTAGGVFLDRYVLATYVPPANIPADANGDFRLMAEAWNTIERIYVDRAAIQPQELTYGAISGMTESLGDTGHSRFLTPQMVQQQRNAIQGQFEGIGAEVQEKDGRVVIVAPIDDSPAQRAGLRAGDVIMSVNGQDTAGLSLEEVVQRVLGPAGTSVTLTVLHPDSGQTQTITVVRAQINLKNVTWQRVPGTNIAHIRIAAFSQDVSKELVQALTTVQQQKLTGVILDMRNNPGGLLDEAINTASQFLTSGNVLLEKDAAGKTTPVPVKSGGVAPTIPVVILVNNGTASAAEIVTGALQDAGRAQVVGETTFGTGTVLNQFALSDGSALLLATQEWLTPKGRVIWHQGLKPDYVVPLPANTSMLRPSTEGDMTAAQLRASGDQQFLRALDLLQQ